MSNDQLSLIQNSDSTVPIQQAKAPLAEFIGLQFLQFVCFMISILSPSNFFFLLIQIIVSILNFVACQRYFGRQLVGLSWKFNLTNPTELFWSHEIEPDPFVPTKLNSNAFWIGMAGSTLFWFFATLFSHVSGGWLRPFGYFIILALSCVNLVIFFKIERISAKLSADAVRTVLLGKSEFPDAEEFTSSDNEEADKNDVNASGVQDVSTTEKNINATNNNNDTDTKEDQEKPNENNDK